VTTKLHKNDYTPSYIGGLLDGIFRFDYEFGVPDVLFEYELRENHADLPEKGLQVLVLEDPDEQVWSVMLRPVLIRGNCIDLFKVRWRWVSCAE